jgi:hypothetical protein
MNPNWNDRFPYFQNNNIIDARLISVRTGRFFDLTVLMESDVDDRISCKSPHFYEKEEIFPLVWTRLDGIGVWRPNNVHDILVKEYGENSLIDTTYKEYSWDAGTKLWIKSSTSL